MMENEWPDSGTSGGGVSLSSRFDIRNVESFRDGHPHDAYDSLRSAGPLQRSPGPADSTVWLATGYEEIRAISSDSEHFTSTAGFRIHSEHRAQMDPAIGRVLSRFMLAMDEPEHALFRKIVSPFFKPSAVSAVEPRVRKSIDRLVRGLRDRETVDFVNDIGAIVPISTICALIGVPAEDEQRIFEFTNAVFGTDDPELAPSLEIANERYLEFFDYGWSLLEQRRREPTNDLISHIAHAELSDGRKLTRDEQISFFSNLIAAGNETTRSSLSGAIYLLFHHPDQRRLLAEEPVRIPSAVQEILRHYSPVIHMSRTAICDVDIGDMTVATGDRVALLYGAGNHDPAVFSNPHQFDCSRKDSMRHLAFGYGIHHCLGNRLAVLQLSLILEAFLKAFPDYELTGDASFIKSNFVLAMKSLPMRLQGALQ